MTKEEKFEKDYEKLVLKHGLRIIAIPHFKWDNADGFKVVSLLKLAEVEKDESNDDKTKNKQ